MEKNVTEQNKDKAPASSDTGAKKSFVSFGMHTQRWGTYFTVDWFWNYISGMAFACWGRYTDLGKRIWSEPAEKFATRMARNLFKISEHGLRKSVGNIVAFASVIVGGTLFTLPPLMYLEKKERRKAWVKWIDEHYYGKDKVANDPRFKEAYDSIDREPKKDFWPGMGARVVSLAPLLAIVMFERPFEFCRPYFAAVERGSERVFNAVGLTKKRLYGKLSDIPSIEYDPVKHPGKLASPQGREWKWLHENSAIDFGLEPWYAILHMVTFWSFSKMFSKKKPEPAVDKKVHAPLIATANTQQPIDEQPKQQPTVQVSGIERQPVADTPYLAARGNL